jgi:hypothetical protein
MKYDSCGFFIDAIFPFEAFTVGPSLFGAFITDSAKYFQMVFLYVFK